MTDRLDDRASSTAPVVYRVRFDECTPAGSLRSSGYLRYAQDVAWIHSERLGYDRTWYAERRIGWLVRGIQLVVLEPSGASDELLFTTRVVGYRRVLARRRADVRAAGGRLVAIVLTDYVMIDKRGGPTRVPAELSTRFGVPTEPFLPTRVTLPAAPSSAVSLHFTSRPHELDPMGHVNHAVYLDWVVEAASSAAISIPCRYRLEYLLPVAPESALVATAWPMETGFACRLADEGGVDRFRAIVEPGLTEPWVGATSAPVGVDGGTGTGRPGAPPHRPRDPCVCARPHPLSPIRITPGTCGSSAGGTCADAPPRYVGGTSDDSPTGDEGAMALPSTLGEASG
jgi:acyl-CoA thioesterase FadM